MTFKKDISLFFNLIKTSTKNKVLFPDTIKYYKIRKLLEILVKYGIIYSFGLDNNNLYVNRNTYVTLNILYFNKIKYFSNYKIKSFVAKNPDNIYIVSNSIGIFDSKDLIKLNLGGYLLFIIKTKGSLT